MPQIGQAPGSVPHDLRDASGRCIRPASSAASADPARAPCRTSGRRRADPVDLGVHRADVPCAGLRGRGRRIDRGRARRRKERLGRRLEAREAGAMAEVVALALVVPGAGGVGRIDGHAADGIADPGSVIVELIARPSGRGPVPRPRPQGRRESGSRAGDRRGTCERGPPACAASLRAPGSSGRGPRCAAVRSA